MRRVSTEGFLWYSNRTEGFFKDTLQKKKPSLIIEYKIIIHMSQNELNMFFFIEPHFHPVFPTVFFSFDAYKEEQSGFINYSAKFSSFRAGLVESNTFKARMNKHNFKVHRVE